MASERLQTCETTVRKLTESLGWTELWADQVLVEPANVTTSHTCDGDQGVFVALTDGQVGIEGEICEVPAGELVRVHKHTTRNLLNRTEERHVWIVFGTPPVGTDDDSGADVVQDE